MIKGTKYYPWFTYWIIICLVFSVLFLACIPLVWTLLDSTTIAKVISTASLFSFSTILAIFSGYWLKQRKDLISRIVKCWGPLILVDEIGLSERDCFVVNSIKSSVLDYTVYNLNKVLPIDAKVSLDFLKPVTLVYIKSVGSVIINNGGVKNTVKGLAAGHHIEIEWNGSKERFIKLLIHEVSHVLLDHKGIRNQHEVMASAGNI